MTWTLSLDGLVTSGAILALLGVIWRLSARFTTIEDKLREIGKDAEKIANAMTQIALQQQRLDFLEKMMDELRHGEGKVLPLWKSSNEIGAS